VDGLKAVPTENNHGSRPMTINDPSTTDTHLTEVVIAKEDAVFWMDDRGRWQNRHGRFAHKRIIDHFNRSIRRDEDGYYVTQTRGDVREKVYFAYTVTPIFVFQVLAGDPVQLVLNTGETIALDPARLFVESDQLFQGMGDGCIKFSDRALVAMAPYLDENTDGFSIRIGGRTWPIPSQET
jgi:hypothetical protein